MRQHIKLQASFRLATVLAAAHGAAFAAALSALPGAAPALAVPLSASLLYYLLRDAWLRLPRSCIGLVLDHAGATLLTRDGAQTACRIGSGSLVTPGLTILLATPEGGRFSRSVVILPDSMDAESYRRLRVWLKWGEHGGNGPADL